MIFYSIKCVRTNRTLTWERTQADAQAKAKELGGAIVAKEEVPVDSHGLHAWLKVNALGERKAKQSVETLRPTT